MMHQNTVRRADEQRQARAFHLAVQARERAAWKMRLMRFVRSYQLVAEYAAHNAKRHSR